MVKKAEKKKDEFITIRVEKSVKDKLQGIALDNDRSLSWVVGKVLENYVSRKPPAKL